MHGPKSYRVLIGKADGSATKAIFLKSRVLAVDICVALSVVLLGKPLFRYSDCHGTFKQENDAFFIEYSDEVVNSHNEVVS